MKQFRSGWRDGSEWLVGPDERRQAELFFQELMGGPRRAPRPRRAIPRPQPPPPPAVSFEATPSPATPPSASLEDEPREDVPLADRIRPIIDAVRARVLLHWLNGMWMVEMLRELEAMSTAGQLDFLLQHTAEGGDVNLPRILVAVAAVKTKAGGAGASTVSAIQARMTEIALPADQQREVLAYLGATGGSQSSSTPQRSPAASSGAATTSFTRQTYALSTAEIPVVKASDKAKLAEIRESPDTFARAILALAGLDADAWFSSFTTTTFLGRSIGDPIHTDLAAHLKAVERTLADQHGGPNKDPAEAGRALGLTGSIGGSRRSPTSATFSMHLFGLALDVNYTANPFISESANPVFERAGLLVEGKKAAYKDGMSYDEIQALDAVLERYFSYLDDKAALETRLGAVTVAPWSGKSAADAQAQIQADLDFVARKWERSGAKDVIKKGGFLDLKKDLVNGIGLSWGASYGDMMHFDMRNKGNGAKIQSAIGKYKKQKEKEAREKWAKEHGEP